MTHTAVENARAALAAGRCIVIIDEHRDLPAAVLAVAAQHITPTQMTLFVRNSSGTIGVAADGQVLDRLGITAVTAINQHPRGFNMSVPVDVAGLTGGSSAAERVATAHALADPTTTRESFIRPGYTTCFRAQSGGVLRRAGATEAAVDLARLAGCEPVAVMSEAMDDNGELLTPELAQAFAAANDMVLVRIEDVIEYRMEHEPAVERVAEAQLPTGFGTFRVQGFRSLLDGSEHVALIKGDISDGEDVLVRVHAECLLGDVVCSTLCRCNDRLHTALERIEREGRGVLVYVRAQTPQGSGLLARMQAYASGAGTEAAHAAQNDIRNYGLGSQIVRATGVRSLRLLTSTPDRDPRLTGFGLTVRELVAL